MADFADTLANIGRNLPTRDPWVNLRLLRLKEKAEREIEMLGTRCDLIPCHRVEPSIWDPTDAFTEKLALVLMYIGVAVLCGIVGGTIIMAFQYFTLNELFEKCVTNRIPVAENRTPARVVNMVCIQSVIFRSRSGSLRVTFFFLDFSPTSLFLYDT